MPRRRKPPRLYLDPVTGTWAIRDGARFLRTGCAEPDRDGAENRLAAYLGQKHRPAPSPAPLIADVLLAYATDHLPHTMTAKNAAYHIGCLSEFWGDKKLSDVTARACRSFAAKHTPASARRYLETLRAAIGHWHREYGPLGSVPFVTMPPKSDARTRWLTRQEARRLRHASLKGPQHIHRFVVLGLLTGRRAGAILNLTWDRIDLARGVILWRERGEVETNKKKPPGRIGRALIFALRRWRQQDGEFARFVCHYEGRKIRRIEGAWETLIDRAGLDDTVTPHAMRRTRATWGMQKGVDVWELAGHLGMTVETLTREYAQQHPDFQKRAAEI